MQPSKKPDRARTTNFRAKCALQKDDNRMRAINWLYPQDFDKRHIQISGLRRGNTGEWILKAPEVQSWIKDSRLLWGYGIRKYFLIS